MQKSVTKPSQRISNTWDDSFALGDGIAFPFVIVASSSSVTRFGTGIQSIPIGQRISDRYVNKKLRTISTKRNNIHNSVTWVSHLKGVKAVIGILGGRAANNQLRNQHLPVQLCIQLRENVLDSSGKHFVNDGDPSTELAREEMRKIKGAGASAPGRGSIMANLGEGKGVAKAQGREQFEFCVVKPQRLIFTRLTVKSTITHPTTAKETDVLRVR